MRDVITIAALVIRNDHGQVLTVRKRGTHRFMLPGGKPEAGESPDRAVVREVAEELGVHLDPAGLTLLGVHTAPAANEPGHTVHATVYTHPYVAVTEPRAEIETLRWTDPTAPPDDVAPLLRTVVFPALSAAGTARRRGTGRGRTRRGPRG